jgi:hypothetical protein
MGGGEGALQSELQPFKPLNALERKTVKDGFQTRRSSPGHCWRRTGCVQAPIIHAQKTFVAGRFVGNAQTSHSVIELFAISAKNRLDRAIQAAIGPSGDFGAITAFRAFEPI